MLPGGKDESAGSAAGSTRLADNEQSDSVTAIKPEWDESVCKQSRAGGAAAARSVYACRAACRFK
ncbi:hypothetical protein N0M98_10845 [Paenibacillus doosanensis]|nr:hypothetical protein [Paenibacillus doosanensis]